MLLLCTHANPESIGGVATSARRWVQAAEELGTQVIWCQVPVDSSQKYFFFSKIDDAKFFSSTESALAYIKEFHIQVIMTHFATFASKFSMQAKHILGVPLILNVRGNDVTLDIFCVDSNLSKIITEADFIVSVAAHLLLLLDARFGKIYERSAVVHNGLFGDELDLFLNCNQMKKISTNLACIGVWKWKKGLEVCLDAVKLLPFILDSFQLFGNISRVPQTTKESYISLLELGMPPIKKFKHNERHLIFREMNIIIIPSLVEGMPNVLVEAMASGCLIVASDIPGISEVINTYNSGLLFQAGNSFELSSILRDIISEPKTFEYLRVNAQHGAISLSGNPWLKLPESIQVLIC